MSVKLIPVTSSNIKAIGWEDKTLIIEFKNGSKYQYENVPSDVWLGLKNASSVGSYYHNNIKGSYQSSKI